MELSAYLKLFTRVSLIFFSICLFAWVLLVDYRPYLAGLMLGGAASAVNIHLLGARVVRVTQAALSKQDELRKYSIGFISRISTALIAVMLAMRFEELHLPATIAGLLYGSVAMYVAGLVTHLRNQR